MNISRLGRADYMNLYSKGTEKNISKKTFEEEMLELKDKEKQADDEEKETDTEIVVKADGSKVLMITSRMCGTETTMCLQISKPTEMTEDNKTGDDRNVLNCGNGFKETLINSLEVDLR